MKKIIIITALFLLAIKSFSQIETLKIDTPTIERKIIGQYIPSITNPQNNIIVTLGYYLDHKDTYLKDTIYSISILKTTYKQSFNTSITLTTIDKFDTKIFYFTGNQKILDDLYNRLNNGFDLDKNKIDLFTLKNNLDNLNFSVSKGQIFLKKVIYITITNDNKNIEVFSISKKDLDKLFNKNN